MPYVNKEKLNQSLRDAEACGTLAEFAVFVLGDSDTGSEELDEALTALYAANEAAHRVANKLALRYDLELFNEVVDE